MKFGRTFQESIIPEWRFYYMDYDGLKQMLKERTSQGSFFAETDEAAFVERLEMEMQKVFDFRDVKAGELTRHVQHCETSMSFIDSGNQRDLEGEIDRITVELSNLSHFSRLNYTAFVKILKKHDKHTEFMLKPMFMMRLNPRMQQNELLDSLIYRLSKLYDKIRRGVDRLGAEEKQVKGDTHAFVRKTTKYWVHPDNVMEVKCAILRHLPILVFPTAERKVDPAINSVYLDSDKFELYTGRIEKSENAEAIRLRWYGSSNTPNSVFVERKTHREDWTGEVSVKERFQLKEKHLDDFLSGTFSPEDIVDKLRKHEEGLPEKDLQSITQLAKQVQDKVLVSSLSPTVRTFYNRTAFQLPGDARVRISLDTELCMINERMETSIMHWKRRDIGSAHPFPDVPDSQIVRFPYAILEVKLQVEGEQNIPDWITTLTEGPLVEMVPKFSKFIHGVAMLFPDQVQVVPYWLPQMDKDIRKPMSKSSSGDKEFEMTEAAKSASHISIPIVGTDEQDNEKTPLIGTSTTRRPTAASAVRDISDKRIAVPVRVEPKVFFANERTFLSWIHFSIFLGGISSALVGLGDSTARMSGFLFGMVSIMFTLYALHLYRWRATRIRQRDPGPYDDMVGPTLVSVVFLLAMVANMIFSVARK